MELLTQREKLVLPLAACIAAKSRTEVGGHVVPSIDPNVALSTLITAAGQLMKTAVSSVANCTILVSV